MISGLQKKKNEARRRKAQAAKDAVLKVKFGDLQWDHMRACRHNLDKEGDIDLPCSFCRLITMQTRKILLEEEEAAANARAESIVRRGVMRYNLVLNWSKNQSTFYQELPMPNSTVGHMWTVDVCMSRNVVISLEKYSEILNAESEFRKTYPELIFQRELPSVENGDNNSNNVSIFEGDAATASPSIVQETKTADEAIDMDDIRAVLTRRRRVQEVGDFAAVFIQSRIRKMIDRRMVRRKLMVRFEKVLSMDGETEITVDNYKSQQVVDAVPRMIEDVNMKSPRTMGRRFHAIARKREERSSKFERYMSKWLAEKGSLTKFKDFDALEHAKIQHLKNIIAFRDSVMLGLEAVLNHIRPDYAQDESSVAGESLKSQDSDGSMSRKSEGKKRGLISATSSIAASKKGLLKRVGISKDSQDEEQSIVTEGDDVQSLAASLTSVSMAPRRGPSVMLGLSAPGPPTRDLGLSIAIRSSTFDFKAEKGGKTRMRRDGEVTSTILSQMMRQLDVIIWEALRCYTADEVVEKFLLEDVHPPMQSCIHFADDTEQIWCSTRKTLSEDAAEPAQVAKDATKTVGAAGGGSEERGPAKKAAHKEKWKPHMTENQVLPISLQLRPFPRNKPKNAFRLFFLENELVAASPICIWSYYSQIHRKRDSVAKQLKEFACAKDTTQFVHAYFLRANQRLIEAVDVAEYNFDAARRILTKQDKEEAANLQSHRENFSGGTDSAQDARVRSRKGRNGPGIRPLFIPPQDALFDSDIYTPDDEGLLPEKVVALHKRYPFLNKSSKFKPMIVKAQNAMFRKKKTENKILSPEDASGVSASALQSWAVTNPSMTGVLRACTPLLGEELYPFLCHDKYVDKKEEDKERAAGEAPVFKGFAAQSRYYRRLVDLALNVDVGVKDRVKVPRTHKQMLRQWAERQKEKEEVKEKAQVEQELSRGGAAAEEEGDVAAERAKKMPEQEPEQVEDPKPLLPEAVMNLMVMEVVFPDTDSPLQAGDDDDGEVEQDTGGGRESLNTTVGRPTVMQVVGVFNAEREVNPREPGGLDLGLVDWEYLLMQSDIGKFNRTRHPLEWLAQPATTSWGGDYFIPLDKTAKVWSHPDDRGVSMHQVKLKSRKTFRLEIVAQPPPKAYLMEELPRNLRRWLSLE